jgi:hypothetical protein
VWVSTVVLMFIISYLTIMNSKIIYVYIIVFCVPDFFLSHAPEGDLDLVKADWVNKTLLNNDILLYCSKKLYFINYKVPCYALVSSLLLLSPS